MPKLRSIEAFYAAILRYADGDGGCDAVTRGAGSGLSCGQRATEPALRENKYYALAGFWRHAISRGYATRSPLPSDEPKSPARDAAIYLFP